MERLGLEEAVMCLGMGGPVAGAQMGVGAVDGGRWGLSPTWGVFRKLCSGQGEMG